MNNDILIKALDALDIKGAEMSGRNDMVIGDKKISGSAYKINLGKSDGYGKKALHHGTMLLHVDFKQMNNYLSPSKKKLESKGVESVRARVINLRDLRYDLNYDMWMNSMIEEFHQKYEDRDIFTKILSTEEVLKVDKIAEIYEELTEWNWVYGRTPDFTHNIEHKFTWALMDVYFNVKKGAIVSGHVYSDSLYPDFIDTLNDILKDDKNIFKYNDKGIMELSDALRSKLQDDEYYGKELIY